MKNIKLILAIMCCSVAAQGQTEMLNSQYLFDKTFVSPANFSQDETLRVYMNHQSAAGRDRAGGEYMYSAAVNYRADNDRNLVGLNLVSSRFGDETSLVGYVNYTFNLRLTDNAILSNGVGIGFQQYRLNLENVQGPIAVDPLVGDNIFSSKFDFRMGTTAVINQHAFLGIAFDNILSRYNNQEQGAVDYLPASFKRMNMTFMAGNGHAIDQGLDLKYEGLYTYSFGGENSIDINARAVFAKLISAGLAYKRYVRSADRQVLSYGVIRPFLSLDVARTKNKIKFNYAYGFSPNKTNTVGITTHEFGFIYSFTRSQN